MGHRRATSLWIGAGIAAFAAAGCGGGQGGSTSVINQSHTTKSGNAVITYYGQPKPQFSTSSAAVSVFGQAGATFSTVTLEPAPNLADTYLAFGRFANAENNVLLYEMPYSGGAPTLLYQNDGAVGDPSISAYGAVAFVNDVNSELFSIRPDGTGLKQISFTGFTTLNQPSYSTDGTNRLSFLGVASGGYDLCIGPGTGGSPTVLQTGTTVNGGIVQEQNCWNPSGSEIAFCVRRSGAQDIFESPTKAGSTAVDITPVAYQFQGTLGFPSWSIDGVTVACSYTASEAATSSLMTLNVSSGESMVLTPSGNSDTDPCFSPDGSKIAFYRSSAGGATPGIYICDAGGENATLVAADPTGTSANAGIAWSPFLPKETVISASAATFYHQAASGFLVSENGSQFGSVMAFTATTPSSAAIQAPGSSIGAAPLQFTLTADSITSIGYINNYYSPGTTVTLTSTPSALVSIDGTTGQVDLVAPSTVAKPSATKDADGTVSYQGPFKALYDGNGKNLAPNGASQVTVDPKSGKVVRWG